MWQRVVDIFRSPEAILEEERRAARRRQFRCELDARQHELEAQKQQKLAEISMEQGNAHMARARMESALRAERRQKSVLQQGEQNARLSTNLHTLANQMAMGHANERVVNRLSQRGSPAAIGADHAKVSMAVDAYKEALDSLLEDDDEEMNSSEEERIEAHLTRQQLDLVEQLPVAAAAAGSRRDVTAVRDELFSDERR